MHMPTLNALKAAAVLSLAALFLGYGFGQLGAAKAAGTFWLVGLFLPMQVLAMSAAERAPKGIARSSWLVANAAVLVTFLWAGSLLLSN